MYNVDVQVIDLQELKICYALNVDWLHLDEVESIQTVANYPF